MCLAFPQGSMTMDQLSSIDRPYRLYYNVLPVILGGINRVPVINQVTDLQMKQPGVGKEPSTQICLSVELIKETIRLRRLYIMAAYISKPKSKPISASRLQRTAMTTSRL